MARYVAPALAISGGGLLSVAFVVRAAWPAVFFALAAFVLCMQMSSRRQAIWYAAMFGWVAYVGGYHWMQPTLVRFWDGRVALSWLVWLLWGAVVVFRFVVIAWLYGRLRRKGMGAVGCLTLPWVTVEWLYPSLFPFFVGNTLIDQPVLAQAASLGGPLLLSAWVCGVSAVLAQCILWARRRDALPRFAIGVVIVESLALLVYGLLSLRGIERQIAAAPSVTVGIVQANVDVMDKRTERLLSHRRYVDQSKALEARRPVDLLIWPETSYLRAIPDALPTSGAAVHQGLQSPLVFGGIRASAAQGRRQRFNSAMLADADGVIRSAYDKRFLIPFAEFVPLGDRFASWARVAPTLSHFRPGEGGAALQWGAWRIATPICYETIRPAYVRSLVRQSGAHLLVSLTNDGWFGNSAEPHLHLTLARLRAVENRRFLIRATNTGISAIIDPAGKVVAQTDLFTAANLVYPVRMLDQATTYEVWGDWPAQLALILLALVWLRKGSTAS